MSDNDILESGTLVAIADLTNWLKSCLCSCVIDEKNRKQQEQPQQKDVATEEKEEKTESVQKVHAAEEESDRKNIFDGMLADGRILLWLIHSYKPDLISAPPSPIVARVAGEQRSKMQQAFKVAQEELGVQNLFVTDDFEFGGAGDGCCEKRMDTLVLLTYLTRFKCAVENTQPACCKPSSSSPQINLSWRYNVERDCIFLRASATFSAFPPKCGECREEVLILDRFLLLPPSADRDDLVMRHRRCFRCGRCRKLLRIGLYRPSKSGTGYECLEHEKEDLANRLTPAPPEPKNGQSDDGHAEKEDATPNIKENEVKANSGVYPILPEEEQKQAKRELYPLLITPADQETASSSTPDLTKTTATAEKSDCLSPPHVPNRSRSSERDAPIPAPRKGKQQHSSTDIRDASSLSSTDVRTTTKPDRPPARPSDPPSNRNSSVVQLRKDYPDDLNPFGEEEESPSDRRHSAMPGSSTANAAEKKSAAPVGDNKRRSLANVASTSISDQQQKENHNNHANISTSKKTYDDSLNPFASEDSGQDDDGDDASSASSLSSTNPFNDDDEDNEKSTTRGAKAVKNAADPKKVPPPRPPPPSRPPVGNAATAAKDAAAAAKKRPAPPPPPSMTAGPPPPRPKSPEKQHRKKRPAPPRPLPLKRQIRTECALSPDQLASAFDDNENALSRVESDGATFETDLRGQIDERGFAKVSNDVINEWISLVREKFELMGKETELVYACRERQLDELHAEIEYQLRCVIEKPESEKTPEDTEREASLLQRMLDVIEEKSKLVDTQDELRGYTGGTLPRNSIHLDDCSSSSGRTSKGSTLEDGRKGNKGDQNNQQNKQDKKKKKIKLRLKKLKQKIATSTLLHHHS